MKFSSSAVSSLLLLCLPSFSRVKAQGNPQECVTDYDETRDYFPDKSQVEFAEQFSLEYGLNYKIATNIGVGQSYLLYQCGTPIPDLNLTLFDLVIPVPLDTFGLHYSTFVPFAELLGLRGLQTVQAGQPDNFFSPCFNELIDTKEVALIANQGNATQLSEAGVSKDVPFFLGPFSSSAFDTNIIFAEYFDVTNLGVFEWIKFMGVFFNREVQANEAFENEKARYECGADNADLLSADSNTTKTVLWASYSNFPGFQGFYPASSCPNYYCELAEACGAELLIAGGPLNITEFVDFGRDADVWLYDGTDFESVLNEFDQELQELKSVQDNELFDVLGHGEDAWFNERKVEPAALLEDFCHMVGTESPAFPHIPAFFRRIDNPEVSPGECTDQCASYRHLGSFCQPITFDGSIPPPAPTPLLPDNCPVTDPPTLSPTGDPTMGTDTPTVSPTLIDSAADALAAPTLAATLLALVATLI